MFALALVALGFASDLEQGSKLSLQDATAVADEIRKFFFGLRLQLPVLGMRFVSDLEHGSELLQSATVVADDIRKIFFGLCLQFWV